MPSPIPIDLTGQHFGEWEVLRYLGKGKWECRCSCGAIKGVQSYKLKHGDSTSCGHGRNKFIDLTGQHFGEWEVIDYAGNHIWNCRCSCGKMGRVASKALRDGKSLSCGHSTTAFKDVTGQKFNEWTALEYQGLTIWKCRCSCGAMGNVKLSDLINGKSKSCGHATTKLIDLTGKVFGYLKVEEYLGNELWKCRCVCGNTHVVKGQRLRMGVATSCGCMSSEKTKQTNLEKYGVPYSAQRNRTTEQVEMTESPSQLIHAISKNFKEKPTPKELGELIGVTPHRAMVIARNLGVENFVTLDKYLSQYEDELNELFPCEHRSDRTLLKELELDLYYPENKFAIEFNGDYWHSEEFKASTYHQHKTLMANKQGVGVIHIFEYEWKNKKVKEQLINLIQRRFGMNSRVVYARNCIVTEISNEEAVEFTNRYHLQGGVNSQINIGISYNDDLLGIMTFSTPRFNGEYQYELVRLAWMSGVNVVGGSEKMFGYFKNRYNPESVISYCDISKFQGEVYSRLGFKNDGLTPPNYKWVMPVTHEVISRYKAQKHKLVEKSLGNLSETEAIIMHRLGYVRVYDCGNLRFIWSRDGNE